MAGRGNPVTLRDGKDKVRCASNRDYAVVTRSGLFAAPKVILRSDNPKVIVQRVRRGATWFLVFDLHTAELIWSGTTTDWQTLESRLTTWHAAKGR
jgi:hypothetical protein